MAKRDEVGVLGEAINHGDDDELPSHLWRPIDEVEQDVSPNLEWHLEVLQ